MSNDTDQLYVTSPKPQLDADWRSAGYCVLDLETTGLDTHHHEIISYAAVPIDDGRVVLGDARHGFVRPSGSISPESVRIHGIRTDDLASAPPLDEALDDLLTAMAGRVLVVHVDWVERGFLTAALRPRGLRLNEPVLDTNRIAHAYLPDLPEFVNLGRLADRLKLPCYPEHEALADAMTTAQVFLALATLLDHNAPQSIASLSEFGTHKSIRERITARLRNSSS
jgi:DNA polymerase III subunit epsilon